MHQEGTEWSVGHPQCRRPLHVSTLNQPLALRIKLPYLGLDKSQNPSTWRWSLWHQWPAPLKHACFQPLKYCQPPVTKGATKVSPWKYMEILRSENIRKASWNYTNIRWTWLNPPCSPPRSLPCVCSPLCNTLKSSSLPPRSSSKDTRNTDKYSTCRTWSLPGAFTKKQHTIHWYPLILAWTPSCRSLASQCQCYRGWGIPWSLGPWIHQTGEAAHPCQSPSCREPRNKHLCTGQLGSWEASSFWKKLQHSFAVWWVFSLWWMHDEQHWTTTNAPETGQATRCTVWSVWFAASRVRHVALPLRFRLKICRVQESNDVVTSDSGWFYLILLIDPFIAGIEKAQSDTVWLESCG